MNSSIIHQSKLLYIKYFQYLFIPLMYVLNKLLIETRTINLEPAKIDSNNRYVIVANHQSMLDPFIICYSLGVKIHKQFVPYRFFITNRMFNHLWLRFWLFSFGGFPAKWHRKYRYGLSHATNLVDRGQTVVIFPEGRISHIDRAVSPKKGIEVLANMENVFIIPARIKWNRQKGLLKSYSLAVSDPFVAKHMTADQIMDVVYNIKFR